MPGRHFKTAEIRWQPVALEVYMHNVLIVPTAPNLHTNRCEAHIDGGIFAHGQATGAPLQHILGAFGADDRMRQAVFEGGRISH